MLRSLARRVANTAAPALRRRTGAIRHISTTRPVCASASSAPSSVGMATPDNGRSFDTIYEDVQINKGDKSQRAFTYLTLGGARFIYASAARLAVIAFLSSWSASADVLALAALEVDLNKVDPGTTVTVKWRGKPVFIRNRTQEEIDAALSCDVGSLRDPQTDEERRNDNPNWLIVLGVCTHLGCVPLTNQGEYNGWYCPCHGSHYDTSGRIRKGPAPLNLEVPEWSFLGDDKVKLG